MRNPLRTIRWSIQRKLNLTVVLPALVVTTVLMGIHLMSTEWIGEELGDTSRSLRDELRVEVASTMRAQAAKTVRLRAEGIAGQIRVYLRAHPGRSLEELSTDPTFRKLAVQPVGQGGYTCLAVSGPARLLLHKYDEFEGLGMVEMGRKNQELSRTLTAALEGESGTLRYMWQDPDGKQRGKFLHCLPIDVPGPSGVRLALAATIYADEFGYSGQAIDRAIVSHRRDMQETVRSVQAWTGGLAVGFGLVTALLACGVGLRVMCHLGRRVDRLVNVAEDVEAGKQPIAPAETKTDELGRLEVSLLRMAATLGQREHQQQSMNRELKQRVNERTAELKKANRRLAEILREKQATAAELEQQFCFAAALRDTIPSPLFYKDSEGVYRDCNRAFAEDIIGLPRDQIVGRTLFDLPIRIPSDLAAKYHQKDLDLLASGGRQSYEGLVKTTGGELRHHLFHKAVFKNSDGKAVGLIGVMLDIHDRKEAEKTVCEQREHLRIVLASILDGVITVSSDGVIRSINPAAERILGSSRRDEGRPAVEVVRIRDENSGKCIEEPLEWALHTSQADRDLLTDLVLTGVDGVDRPISLTASRIDEDGIVLTFRDETELRTHRREKQRLLVDLRERVKELDCLVQLSHIVEEPGITLERIIEQCVHVLPAAYRYPEQAGSEIALDGQTHATGECLPGSPTQSADLHVCGQVRGWVRVFYPETILGAEDQEVFLPSERVMLDAFAERLGRIAERKHHERELLEIRAAVDGASDGIMLLNAEGNVHYCNEAFRELFDCKTREMGCEAPLCLFGREDNVRIADIAERGVRWQAERLLETCAGKSFTGDVRVTPVLDSDERIGTLIAVADVTHRRRLEEQIRNAQKLTAVGQLAAGIAHEINTPTQFVGDNLHFLQEDLIAALARLAELRSQLGDGDIQASRAAVGEADALALTRRVLREIDLDYLEQEVPDALSQSLEGIERIASIVAAMKDFSHSRGSGEWSQVDLGRMIQSTVTLTRNEWKYCAEIELDVSDDLPLVPCLANDISQVFLNLLTNAAQAIKDVSQEGDERGRITISVRRDGSQVEVRVTDTGSGIPEDIHSKVFEPFFTTKEVGEGTGQGLSIAHATVVEGHGGFIGFTTEVGQGTTFIVQLPLERAKSGEELVSGRRLAGRATP